MKVVGCPVSDSKMAEIPVLVLWTSPLYGSHSRRVHMVDCVLELFFPPTLVALQPVYWGGLSPVALAPLGSRSREGSAHVLSGSQGGAFSCWAQRNHLRLRGHAFISLLPQRGLLCGLSVHFLGVLRSLNVVPVSSWYEKVKKRYCIC